MFNVFVSICSVALIGFAFGAEFFEGNEIIGPCIDNSCPLSYECKNDLCILAKEQHTEFTTVDLFEPQDDISTTLSDIPLTYSSFPFDDASSTNFPEESDTDLLTTSSPESDITTTVEELSSSVLPSASSETPLEIFTTSATVSTKSVFDFGSPCFFGSCPTGYECKHFWCVRTTSATSLSPSSVPTTQYLGFTTEEPSEITGPCIGNSCPDDTSICKNGFCVKPSSAPGTCKDKRFGCALISYLCNIFTDLMTEDCAYTCKKC